jgi:hypothetical protein
MVLALAVFFLYFSNISILFQNQSIVVFFSFWILLYFLNKYYLNLKSTSFQTDILEWIEMMQFFIMMKNWSMLSIRLLNIKLYNFYKFIQFMKNEIIYILTDVFYITYNFYLNNINKCAIWNLDRLVSKCKSLTLIKLDLSYLLSLY